MKFDPEVLRDKSPRVTDREALAAALSNIGTMSPRLRKLYDDAAAQLRAGACSLIQAPIGTHMTPAHAPDAQSGRDWSLLEATQESLREHMAEIQRLRAALAQPATIAEWWAAKQAASGEPFGYLWPTGMHPEFRFYQQKRNGVDGMPLYATAQPAPARVPVLTQELIREARQDAVEVFDAEGPETPQIVREVIEYMASWLVVYADKAGTAYGRAGAGAGGMDVRA